MLHCSICEETALPEKMNQFIPCLHIFCKRCTDRWQAVRKMEAEAKKQQNSTGVSTRLNASSVMCLASNCFSVLNEYNTKRLNWKRCENRFCPRQLSFVVLETLPCNHQLCSACLRNCKKLPMPICPVEGCSAKIFDDDDSDLCDNDCKNHLKTGEYVTTKCCQAKICFACFENMFGHKPIKDEEVTCPTQCFKQISVAEIPQCKAKPNCKNVAINGFPSKGECDHGICIPCLEQMIDDCEVVGSIPRCPNVSCNALYCIETVIALREILPNKSAFFDKFVLDDSCCDVFKDETVTSIEFSKDFKSAGRCVEIDVKSTDNNEHKKLQFDREGTIGDLMREIRRELKIEPAEKVYGYYVMRSPSAESKFDEGILDKSAEKLDFSPQSVGETVEKLNLSAAVTIVADTIGVVQAKSDVVLSGEGSGS